jgi:hypothetical protein
MSMTSDERTLTFSGEDYRDLLDILIDANVKMDRAQRRALQVEIGGKAYGLTGIAALINEKVGYETPLTDAHHDRLNADYHNRLIKKAQHGYGRAAKNLADLALGVGAFHVPSPAQRQVKERIWEQERQREAAERAAREEAAREAAALEARKLALQSAALAAHPGWREVTEPILAVNGRTFVKTDVKAPGTLNGLIRWFERTHPEVTERIRTAALDEGTSY